MSCNGAAANGFVSGKSPAYVRFTPPSRVDCSRCEVTLAAVSHRAEELSVALGLRHLRQQQLHRLGWGQWRQNFAKHPDAIEVLSRDEHLFFARSAFLNVDRWEHTPVGQFAIEVDLQVAGPLEFFEDDFVH